MAARHSAEGFSSVLWVGPPNASPLWRGNHRAPRPWPSRRSNPRYDNGANPSAFRRPRTAGDSTKGTQGPWEGTRVLFSAARRQTDDVVVAGSPLFNRPDWLQGTSGHDRHGRRCAGIRSHVLAGCRRHDERPRSGLAATATIRAGLVLDGWRRRRGARRVEA